MKYLILLTVLLVGCAIESKLIMRCKGDCTLDMGRDAEITQPETTLGLPNEKDLPSRRLSRPERPSADD